MKIQKTPFATLPIIALLFVIPLAAHHGWAAFESEKEITLGNGLKIVTPYYDLYGYTVWGATAMIMGELKTIVNEIIKS